MLKKPVLFMSNGHGEDLNASLILQALVKIAPQIIVSGMPLVGEGNAYHSLDIPILGQPQNLPSGGIFYMNIFTLLKDLSAGLIGLTIYQIRTLLKSSSNYNLIVAVGDIFPITMAYISGRPYVAFLVSTSSFYEGKLRLPWLTRLGLRSPRCLAIFTRDNFTAEDLQNQGMKKAIFAGYPIMDVLTPTGQDLHLNPDLPMIALLPGSRVPEAIHNLELQLQVCEVLADLETVQFRIALVKSITELDLENLAKKQGWDYQFPGIFTKKLTDKIIIIQGYYNAFADIIYQCNLAIGMAGTAVEQVVGLGKPVIQLPGKGPQFTYEFAEAQMRLLGTSITTIGNSYKNPAMFTQAAQTIQKILRDNDYLENCVKNGQERVGKPGGSQGIAEAIAKFI
ncbi:lipid-A-disaccharide synthase-related protein [Crocosphaera sp. XPORK-15E]|uniref:lipid-A-disaccharide synthase-related protein n=1 Tax=Crocosphaera sp. XPORK-15E TaxID=3110247 RepID=UPI002B209442|nr:lipid-A-disaccharide synthase-related protein [Crocosphaera sp. XPORK-15E]MEA5535407.1 lipid-A-disaccharide synthase-related protein [Crocosphaera sp. XPORK-15E]